MNFWKDYGLKKDFRVPVVFRQCFGDGKPISGNKTTEGGTKNWRVKIDPLILTLDSVGPQVSLSLSLKARLDDP